MLLVVVLKLPPPLLLLLLLMLLYGVQAHTLPLVPTLPLLKRSCSLQLLASEPL